MNKMRFGKLKLQEDVKLQEDDIKENNILEVLDKLSKGHHTIAIAGRCAAGKTTLAKQLAMHIGAGVVHMDDFFLPMELRTPDRLAQPGGNVHYERFQEEILPFLKEGSSFTYRKLDCSTMKLGADIIVRRSLG